MNLDQEWRILVNMARRRLRAGSSRCEDQAIVEAGEVLNYLIKNHTNTPESMQKIYEGICQRNSE